jgi:hypothetical protein
MATTRCWPPMPPIAPAIMAKRSRPPAAAPLPAAMPARRGVEPRWPGDHRLCRGPCAGEAGLWLSHRLQGPGGGDQWRYRRQRRRGAGGQGGRCADPRSPATAPGRRHHRGLDGQRPAAHRADHAGHIELSHHARTGRRSGGAAGVRELVLTHIAPPLPSRLFHAAFLGDAPQRFGGRIRIADDGLRCSCRPAARRSRTPYDAL